jgi:cation diffusion facilitator family transporter
MSARDYPAIRRVLVLTMLLNWLAAGVKLAVGALTGALSLVADGLDSLLDGLANIVGLIGITVGSRPPDADHPYGHRKYETMAALVIASLLFFTAWELAESAVARLRHPEAVIVNRWSVAALLFSMAVQAGASAYEMRQGRRLHSEVLVADALHARASILTSLAVLGGLLVVRWGYPVADPMLTLVVAAFIVKIGLDIVRENSPTLLDRAAVDERVVAAIVGGVPGVESFHRIRSRGPADAGALDLHIRVAPELTMQQANAIADEVRRRLLDLKTIADVTVHIEAQRRPGREVHDIVPVIQHTAAERGLHVHEIWARRLGNQLVLEAHVGVDPDMTVEQAHEAVERFAQACLQRLPQFAEFRTHIELHSPAVLPGAEVSQTLRHQVTKAVYEAVAETTGLREPHNISVRQSEGRLITSFDVLADRNLPIAMAHELTSLVEARLRSQVPSLTDVLIHVEPSDVDTLPAG